MSQIPSKEQLIDIYQLVEALEQTYKYNKFDLYYPDVGEFSRDKYSKHMEVISRLSKADVVGLVGGNGTGKSFLGSYIVRVIATGKYPCWWDAVGGPRFNGPISIWVGAREAKQLRESIQEIMFGKNLADPGTGIIPKTDFLDLDGKSTIKQMEGASECVGLCKIRHYDKLGNFDGFSTIHFKRYSQGWQEFQGSNRDFIWLDEEPDDAKIYSECFSRLRGPKGHTGKMLCTFTPLLGFSDVYLGFMPDGEFPKDGIHPNDPKQHTVQITWDDVPHLDEEWKQSAIAKYKLYDPNSIDARSKGQASAGSGRIYPVIEQDVVVQPFKIPDFWPRAYGLDFGWNMTAAIWAAKDPNTGVLYLYSEYYRGKLIPQMHVANIQAKGKKIPGAYDPSGGGRNENGRMISDIFRTLGLNIVPGSNDASLRAVILNMFETGALKIFSTLENFLKELRIYRYDFKNPNVPKKDQADHLLDALKYLISQFDYIARSEIQMKPKLHSPKKRKNRDRLTGY